MNERDKAVLIKLLQYIQEIEETIERFDANLQTFKSDFVVKNALSMCLLQIGELTAHLTDEFRLRHSDLPWRDIVAVRNRAAHGYNAMDLELVWGMIQNRIPELKDFCEKILLESGK
ncbi:MAG: DUF86 domain-containing protein [Planctomycetaceae bacterium]|jgi:uncharacterized protein with HEPN domain|nr:DUF86 domain-containing protein [Planctomycetaceae bacterium]